jgi:parallel beta-helix repeat protein
MMPAQHHGEAVMRTISSILLVLSVTACAVGHDSTSPPLNASATGLNKSLLTTSVSCGDVITSDVRLENDLACAGDGFSVSGTGLNINLNGHTISGSGTGVGVGIRVTASQDVSIYGGTFRGFLQAMFVAASSGIVIKDNEFTQNGTAVLFQATSGSTIKSNVARQNTFRAFMLRPNIFGVLSTDNEIVENVLIDNPTGVFLISQPGNTFKGNTISGSTVAAIDMTFPPGASGNVFKGNLLSANAAGFRFAAGWTDNTILGNTLDGNSCAFQGPTAGNTLQGNTLSGNTTDFCP